MHKQVLSHLGNSFEVRLDAKNEREISAEINGERTDMFLQKVAGNLFAVFHQERLLTVYLAEDAQKIHVFVNGEQYSFDKPSLSKAGGYRPGMEAGLQEGNDICAPMPGKLLKLFVKEGQEIGANDRLFIVEAMKMENEVRAKRSGVIKKINFKENDLVSVGEAVIELESGS